MNHHEALGRYIELKETMEAARHRRNALLNNLAVAAGRAAAREDAPFDFAAARALLEGAERETDQLLALAPRFRAAAEACGKG